MFGLRYGCTLVDLGSRMEMLFFTLDFSGAFVLMIGNGYVVGVGGGEGLEEAEK